MANQYETWTKEELKILKDVTLSNSEVTKLINRTYNAVKAKRNALNIVSQNKSIDYWEQDEIKLLITNKDKSNVEMAKLLNRTVQAIQLKRAKLNLLAPSKNWDIEEIEYLIEHYFFKDKKEISEFLGRSVNSIYDKASELGLSKNIDFWRKHEEELLRDNFHLSIDALNKLIPSKTRNQIIYKRGHMKKIELLKDEENISTDVEYFKNKKNRMFNLLNILEVGESFEIENKDYMNFISSKNLIRNKLFKTKKIDQTTRRVWRID